MQIGNYRACATIIILRNEFSKNEGDFRKNPTEAIIVLYEYFRYLRIYGGTIVNLRLSSME